MLPSTFFRWLPALLLCLLTGCGFGTRFIFSPSHDIQGMPEEVGLPYEEVWFPAEDGVLLNGWLIPAASDQPLVLYFHGNAANITHRVEILSYLHSLGFPVFIFDYRGFGRSDGFPTREEDLYRDGRGALAWLKRRGWSEDRLVYFGRSLGAAIAVQMALEAPPAGLVLESAFTSLAGIARHMTPITYGLFGWWSIGGGFDNLGKIRRIDAPLLLIQGARDEIVPPRMARQLYARAPEPKRLLLVAGGGHSDCFLTGGASYRRAWLQFAALPKGSIPSRTASAPVSSPAGTPP